MVGGEEPVGLTGFPQRQGGSRSKTALNTWIIVRFAVTGATGCSREADTFLHALFDSMVTDENAIFVVVLRHSLMS